MILLSLENSDVKYRTVGERLNSSLYKDYTNIFKVEDIYVRMDIFGFFIYVDIW